MFAHLMFDTPLVISVLVCFNISVNWPNVALRVSPLSNKSSQLLASRLVLSLIQTAGLICGLLHRASEKWLVDNGQLKNVSLLCALARCVPRVRWIEDRSREAEDR